MGVSNMQTLEVASDYRHLGDANLISNAFSWLNRYMLCFPMIVVVHPSGHRRCSRYTYISVATLTALCCVFHSAAVSWWIVKYWSQQYFAQIAFLTQEVVILIIRVITGIYYARHF